MDWKKWEKICFNLKPKFIGKLISYDEVIWKLIRSVIFVPFEFISVYYLRERISFPFCLCLSFIGNGVTSEIRKFSIGRHSLEQIRLFSHFLPRIFNLLSRENNCSIPRKRKKKLEKIHLTESFFPNFENNFIITCRKKILEPSEAKPVVDWAEWEEADQPFFWVNAWTYCATKSSLWKSTLCSKKDPFLQPSCSALRAQFENFFVLSGLSKVFCTVWRLVARYT